MPQSFKHLWPLGLVFLVLSVAIFFLQPLLAKYNIDATLLFAANGLFFLISLIAYAFQYKALQHKNPNVFIRSVMGGMMMKMVICIAAIFIYVTASGGDYNKKGILVAMLMYMIFLGAEVLSLMKLNRRQHG